MEESPDKEQVDRVLLDQIETVPHLEALLLLWNSRPRPWSIEDLAARLYLDGQGVKQVIDDLTNRELVEADPGSNLHRYRASPVSDRLVGAVDATYRREVIRVSNMIHAKGPASVRAFARAFRIRKDRD
jgi:predicted ArsR family transcriptional regulator